MLLVRTQKACGISQRYMTSDELMGFFWTLNMFTFTARSN